MPFKSPFNNAWYDSPQVIVPTHVLNSIVAAQNNFTSIVKDLSAKKTVAEEEGGKSDGEDTPITKKELRRFLQNRREVSDFMWDVDPPFSMTIAAKPYPPGYQPPHFRKFDGTGIAKEHIISFLDDLGIQRLETEGVFKVTDREGLHLVHQVEVKLHQ